jgi:hypothetical protein
LSRSVTELLNLQPGVVPAGNNLQSRTSGAIDDQNTVTLDGIDITAVVTAISTSIPAPQDSVEEFRMNVSNPNSDLTRASGGPVDAGWPSTAGTNSMVRATASSRTRY